MTIEITDCKKPLTERTLNTIERRLGIHFPDDYRSFLLAHNGGRPKQKSFQYMNAQGPYTDSYIDWFLSIYDGEYCNLEDYFERYKGSEPRVPSELLPIAIDPGSNLVCISTKGSDRGKVYFWDHEEESPD